MSKVVHPFAIPAQEAALAQTDVAAAHRVNLEELIHELRQPLSVIESLAYYLELTATEDKVCTHLQKIRAMLLKANAILERTSSNDALAMAGHAQADYTG
ncbi:MAG: hypothetical protein JOY54_17950 [Acidobacteriaceae bacterium]|nr:hypothetical protein [Acidobacteriaceae bacterium]